MGMDDGSATIETRGPTPSLTVAAKHLGGNDAQNWRILVSDVVANDFVPAAMAWSPASFRRRRIQIDGRELPIVTR